MFQKFLSVLCGVMLFAVAANATELSATVEPQQVQYGDTVQFKVTYDGESLGEPDFSALNSDFVIYSTGTSVHSSYFSATGAHRMITYTLLLMPKREGDLQIPAIKFGNKSTKPLTVKVYAAGQNVSLNTQNQSAQSSATNTNNSELQQSKSNKNFWAEVSVGNKNPYIWQIVYVTLYVYDNRGIDFRQMPVFDNTDDWLIYQVDEPEVTTKGKQRMIAFKYAFVAQKSGKLAIPRAQIVGIYTDSTKTPVISFSMFNLNRMFVDQKPVMLETKPIEVNVRPVPEDYGQVWWLPATDLTLNAKWVDKQPVFKVGEAVTREISIVGADVIENRMPTLNLSSNSLWKQYPEKPQIKSVWYKNQMLVQSVIRVVYIPQKGGEQTIPELKLRWYNVKTDHIETAIIPAETVYVTGESAAQPEQEVLPQQTPQYEPQSYPEYDKAVNSGIDDLMQKIKLGAWLVLAFVVGLLVSFLFIRRQTRTAQPKNELSKSDCMRQIKKCLADKNYRELRDALLLWSEQEFQAANVKNLDDLSELIDSKDFHEQMCRLNSNLYADGQNDLDAEIICDSLKAKYRKSRRKIKQPLPDLYK